MNITTNKQTKMSKGERRLIRLLCFALFVALFLPWMPYAKKADAIEYSYQSMVAYADTLTCPECGATNADSAASAIISMDRGTINEPTCTNEGNVSYYCSNHPTSVFVATATLDKLEHSWETIDQTNPLKSNYQPATCTSTETWTQHCLTCNTDYSFTGAPAIGHNYEEFSRTNATCIEKGSITYLCSNCKDSYSNEIAALGHDYKISSTKAATCTAKGSETYTCARCKDSYNKELSALGHNMPREWKVEKEAKEGADGLEYRNCTRCGYKETRIIPMLPVSSENEDSGIDSSGNIESSGNESSGNIENSENESSNEDSGIESENAGIPVSNGGHDSLRPILITVGGVACAGILYIILSKAGAIGGKKVAEATIEKVAEEIAKDATEILAENAAEKLLKPSFKDRAVGGFFKDRDKDFVKLLKAQHFIEVSESETLIDIPEIVSDQDLVILSLDSGDFDLLEDVLKAIEKQNEEPEEDQNEQIEEAQDEEQNQQEADIDDSETNVVLIVGDSIADEKADYLEQLIEEGKIQAYVPASSNAAVKIVKLILPCFKPDLKSDEGLENIGMVADALSIPGISALISIYTAGREIKETIEAQDEEDGLAFTDKATIISDIASILGLDTISSVAGLVGDIDDIKSTLTSDVSANAAKTGKEAVEDIIDVAKELL